MPPTRLASPPRTRADDTDTPFAGFDDTNSDSDVEMADKDDEEAALERAVFGDRAGFFSGIEDMARSTGKEMVLHEGGEEEGGEREGMEGLEDADLFMIDTAGVTVDLPSADEESDTEAAAQAAWDDSGDERVAVSLATGGARLRKLRRTEVEDVVSGREYSRRLRKQFALLHPTPAWATQSPAKKRRMSAGDDSSAEESADEADVSAMPLAKLLRDAEALSGAAPAVPGKKRKLRSEIIEIQRLRDICGNGPSAITTLQIHPTLPLLLASGPSSTMSLYHLSPQPPNPNPLLTSLHIAHTPLTSTVFHPSPADPRIFLSARRRYFHIWNLASGRVERISRLSPHPAEQRSTETLRVSPDGTYIALQGSARKGGGVINVLSASTAQWIAAARVDAAGGIADFVWWADGRGFTVLGKNGAVTEWEVESRSAVARWVDQGAVGSTTLALGGAAVHGLGGDRWVAVGSSSGVVNVYDRRALAATCAAEEGKTVHPAPLRVLDQLTTPVSHLAFSPDGQVMAMASRWKADALRLVHLPSCAVYRNWPTSKTPLGRVSAVSWGAHGGESGGSVLVVGNEQGKIRAWEVCG
ncbi:WD40 repeat-like protein [Trichodelitschia bisporula]|uniref:WD40 repeat-like protein n=1 Tax=Trichodelitschia bisporula TaxID=703511 RepID=A0A6G1I389_9PEZI|nr:WD40 repeat-like protein [Trichodelitschia bisporula]